mmetsp:Transcript_7361/g.20824  ORF Transcript_7361/g.20824 Transcript_7361/m.20824 type:complete len:83 (+) Transcript_7361:176-424(+)
MAPAAEVEVSLAVSSMLGVEPMEVPPRALQHTMRRKRMTRCQIREKLLASLETMVRSGCLESKLKRHCTRSPSIFLQLQSVA